jgi:RNA polymerase sigma-70 factor (ECF subfamily)
MYPVCLRYATDEDEALDILHEGFIKVFRYIAKYQIDTSLTAWIKRIMINTAIDYYRKKSRRRVEDIDTAKAVFSDIPDAVSMISAEEIIEALQALSPAYRSVFNLYIIEGYSHKEVAELLNITESTSRSNLVKARQKLRNLLSDKGITNE